jgi:hypothetical protein
MHQYLVTLAVQVRPGVDEPPIVIKVQMSDSLYTSKNGVQRRQIIETCGMETLIDPRGNRKIWANVTTPVSIRVTDVLPIAPPVVETAPQDHQTFSDLFAWVKKPASPFASC